MSTVYLETTIPSYLAARPSRDLIVAAHQQITHEWWNSAADSYDLVISESVLDEIRAGDTTYAARRLEFVADLPVLAFNDDVHELIGEYGRRLGLRRPTCRTSRLPLRIMWIIWSHGIDDTLPTGR